MNKLQLACKRIAYKISRSRLAEFLSEKADDLRSDFRITFLQILNPDALDYDSRIEDRMLRSLKKIRQEMKDGVICVREMIDINLKEINQLKKKLLLLTIKKKNLNLKSF